MGYPRKSYPHRCSPPCAKRSRPRACARVYIIYSSPSRRCGTASRAAVRRVGEGGRQRRTHPRAVPNHAACVPNNAACVPTNAACCAEQCRLCAEQCRLCADQCRLRDEQCRLLCRTTPLVCRTTPLACRTMPLVCRTMPLVCRTMPLVCRAMPLACRTTPLVYRITVRKVGSAQGKPRPCPCALPAATCLRPRPRRLNGNPGSAGGRENDRMAHRRTTTPTHRTQRGNDTCTIRVPRRKGAQSVVHNLYFSSSRPASFCTTFPQSCTDRPVTYRKEHKSPPEGLIFRVLPPAFPPFPPKAIVQNTPAPPPFSPRKTPCFAPTRNRARTLASAGRDNTLRPAHSSRFQRDTNEAAAHEMPIFAPPKAENGGVFGLKC